MAVFKIILIGFLQCHIIFVQCRSYEQEISQNDFSEDTVDEPRGDTPNEKDEKKHGNINDTPSVLQYKGVNKLDFLEHAANNFHIDPRKNVAKDSMENETLFGTTKQDEVFVKNTRFPPGHTTIKYQLFASHDNEDKTEQERIFEMPQILNVAQRFIFPTIEPMSYESELNIEISPGVPFDATIQGDPIGARGPEIRPWDCGLTFTGVRGVIVSPNHPFNYPNNLECKINIQVPENYTVELRCNNVQIQPGTLGSGYCDKDTLVIARDGPPFENITTFCGEGSIHALAEGPNMTLLLQTDNSVHEYNGFLCTYRALNADGSGAPGSDDVFDQEDDSSDMKCPGQFSGRCGQANQAGVSRIVNGFEVPPNKYPWMVAVIEACRDDFKDYDQMCQICGATLIAKKWAITGAHCIARKIPWTLGVLLGDHNLYRLNRNQRFMPILKSYIHPDYNTPTVLNHDIGLLELPVELVFDMYVSPICLPSGNLTEFYESIDYTPSEYNMAELSRDARQVDSSALPPISSEFHSAILNQNVTVYGWGVKDDESTISKILRGVKVEVLENKKCDYYYGIMTDTMFCTSGDGGKGSCRGDSGSPAQMVSADGDYILIGVLAFGAAYGCTRGFPAGNILIPPHMAWIKSVTREAFMRT